MTTWTSPLNNWEVSITVIAPIIENPILNSIDIRIKDILIFEDVATSVSSLEMTAFCSPSIITSSILAYGTRLLLEIKYDNGITLDYKIPLVVMNVSSAASQSISTDNYPMLNFSMVYDTPLVSDIKSKCYKGALADILTDLVEESEVADIDIVIPSKLNIDTKQLRVQTTTSVTLTDLLKSSSILLDTVLKWCITIKGILKITDILDTTLPKYKAKLIMSEDDIAVGNEIFITSYSTSNSSASSEFFYNNDIYTNIDGEYIQLEVSLTPTVSSINRISTFNDSKKNINLGLDANNESLTKQKSRVFSNTVSSLFTDVVRLSLYIPYDVELLDVIDLHIVDNNNKINELLSGPYVVDQITHKLTSNSPFLKIVTMSRLGFNSDYNNNLLGEK